MRKDYEEMLKLSGKDYWDAVEKEARLYLDNNIKVNRNGSCITSEEQKTEYEKLKKDYETALNSPAARGGISAITDVFEWFDLSIDEFSPEADYWLITNMIYEQASIERANALEYGDEWLANQYDRVINRSHR